MSTLTDSLDSVLNNTGNTIFGIAGTYEPKSGGSVAVTVIMGVADRQYDTGDGVTMIMPTTTCKIKVSDLASEPAIGDTLTIGTDVYRVQEHTLDSSRTLYDIDLIRN